MFKYKLIKLNNGLRIITVPDRRIGSLKLQILMRAGANFEYPKDKGINHLLEHMCFQGSKKWPKPDQMRSFIRSTGGFLDASTSSSRMRFEVVVDKNHFDLALEVLFQMCQPIINTQALEKEKSVVLEEIRRDADQLKSALSTLFREALYGKNEPGSWLPCGLEKTVVKINRKQLIHLKDSIFIANNFIVIISGNFSEPKAVKAVSKRFGQMAGGNLPEVLMLQPIFQNKPRLVTQVRDTKQAHIYLGFPSFGRLSPESYVLDVIKAIFNRGSEHSLFNLLRSKLGAVYESSFGNVLMENSGYSVIYMGLNYNKITRVLNDVWEILSDLRDGKIQNQEIKMAKEALKGNLLINLDGCYNFSERIGEEMLYRGKAESINQYIKKIEKVSVKDIKAVSQQVFCANKLNMAYIGVDKYINQIEKVLAKLV